MTWQGFNGAALFQVRKGVVPTFNSDAACLSFNGAALFQVRKENPYRPIRESISRFNGAALFQVRKVRILSTTKNIWWKLQWGRTLSSAERTKHPVACSLLYRRASMGPHSFKCGKLECLRPLSKDVKVLQWGRTLSSAERKPAKFKSGTQYLASMGPHSFKCGKVQYRQAESGFLICFNGAALFQVRKGRRQWSKETGGGRASMGPHSFKCGKTTRQRGNYSATRASMGPHSFKCGKVQYRQAESGFLICFNGAALFQVRKGRRQWSKETGGGRASMGPHSFKCGKTTRQRGNYSATRASMGPHSFKCGKSILPPS